MPPPDTDLWTAWRTRGDSTAFEQLVRPQMAFAVDLARRMGCATADADDAVQESLVLLARESGARAQQVGLRPWLARTVILRSKMLRRGESRRRRREAIVARRPRPADEAATADVREQVEAMLAELPEAERQAVLLHYLYDLDYRDVAFVLGKSEGACRLRVHRGIARLQERFGRNAPALIGGLSIPPATSAHALVSGALAAAASPTASLLGGVLVMNAFAKTAIVAVVAAMVTAGGMLATGARWETGDSAPESSPSRELSGASGGQAASPLPDLAVEREPEPTPEEREFLRRALAEERRRAVAARILPEDSGLEILRRYTKSGAPLEEVFESFEKFQEHVHHSTGKAVTVSATGDVTKVDLSKTANGAAVVEFGPGVFQLERGRGWGNLRDDVVDLEIRGAGMDKTRLIASDDTLLFVTQSLEHLRIQGVTFDGGSRGSMLLDVRGGTAAILDDVRFSGWWPDAGHSAPVGVSGGAYLGFHKCEFLGRQLNNSGGTGISIRGNSIVFMDECVLADIESTIHGWSGASAHSAARFENCTFENTRLTDGRFLYQGKPEFPILVSGGTVAFGPTDWSEQERKEKWGASLASEVQGVSFGRGIARCTVADFIRVLESVKLAGDPLVFAISRHATNRGGAPNAFRFFVADRPSRKKHILKVTFTGDRPEVTEDNRGGGHNIPDPSDMTGALPLVEILRKLPSGTEADEAYSGTRPVGETSEPVVWVEGPDRSSGWMLDARTGEVIQKP